MRQTPQSEIAREVVACSNMKPKFVIRTVYPLTASLKGWSAPKVHIAVGDITLCGRNWRELGWGAGEELTQKVEPSSDYCARCMKKHHPE